MTDSLEVARVYAWNWFEYYALQRMTVFHFFLIFAAILSAGYVRVLDKEPMIGAALGVFLSFIVVAFWRLDQRNVALIKLAEAHLKDHENRLALEVGAGIKLFGQADVERPPFTSFSSILRWVFVVIFCVGVMSASYPFLAQ